jgi:putative endonuclease
MLRCSDDSFYVGSTSHENVQVRPGQHNDGICEGYTFHRRPVSLVWAEWFNDLCDAHVAERRVKGWSRAKKQALIARDWQAIRFLAKRPSARCPSRAASRPPQGDVVLDNRHPEVRAQRASKGDDQERDA